MNSTFHTKQIRDRLIWRLIGWILVAGTIYACQTPVYVTETAPELVDFEEILVMPFRDMSVTPGNTMDTRCPVCGRVFITGDVSDNATEILTTQTTALLQRNTHYRIVQGSLADGADNDLFPINPTANRARQVLVEKGREQNADVVLLGLVYRFKERVGSGYSVESPASVAFDMHLIRVTDGRTIWSAHYDETQQSLGDNLFQLGSFLSRGGRWVTAEELAASGLKEIFRKFPQKDRPGSP